MSPHSCEPYWASRQEENRSKNREPFPEASTPRTRVIKTKHGPGAHGPSTDAATACTSTCTGSRRVCAPFRSALRPLSSISSALRTHNAILSSLRSALRPLSYNLRLLSNNLKLGARANLYNIPSRKLEPNCLLQIVLKVAGASPYNSCFSEEFKGLTMPLGAHVLYCPARTVYDTDETQPRLQVGVFLGYRLSVGHKCNEGHQFVDHEAFVGLDIDQRASCNSVRF